MNYLNCGVNFSCLRVRMKYEGFDCSNVCMPNSYLFDMCEVLVKKKFLLRCETTNENRIFNPGIYIPKLTSSEGEYQNCILNQYVDPFYLLQLLSLFSSKTKHVNFVGLPSQNQIFDSGGCCILLLNGFEHVLHDFNFNVLQVLHKLLATNFSGQMEMVNKNFVFDPGECCSISLFKGFGPWNSNFQNYNLQIPCESGLFPSKKKVKPISVLIPILIHVLFF